jgi:agmatine deiminase
MFQNRRLPAEWEKHQATLLSFPSESPDWPGKFQAVQWAFVDFVSKVVRHEPVILLVKSLKLQEKAVAMLTRAHADLGKISFILLDTNRNWMRDSGSIIVETENGGREAIRFGFNGWAKYSNYRKDKRVPETVAGFLNLPLSKARYKGKLVVLEGGSIDYNGRGTLITTEECLLHPDKQVRNPGFTRQDYEKIFSQYLGITNTIWLGDGIDGDDTHGHVDDICRFVNPDTVVAAREDNLDDPNHGKLARNLERLKEARLENGAKINIVTIPMPGRIDFEDMRLPASYINFMITNTAVFVPTFNDKNDRIALGTLAELFPDREVIGINATDLIWGLGTLHCLSREIPE